MLSAYNFLMVPSAALVGSVAPISLRKSSTAFSFSNAIWFENCECFVAQCLLRLFLVIGDLLLAIGEKSNHQPQTTNHFFFLLICFLATAFLTDTFLAGLEVFLTTLAFFFATGFGADLAFSLSSAFFIVTPISAGLSTT